MKTIVVLGAILLSFFAAPPARGQASCLECRRGALDELVRCQALASAAAERKLCDRGYADMTRECGSGVCAAEIEMRTAARCSDCKSTANAQAQRCTGLPLASLEQTACARQAGDMLAACETRFCRAP
jgi:hypothetical protein